MRAICFYFQVHQPFRLRRYRFFDIGNNHYYFDDFANSNIMRKVAEKCYLPTNQLMYELIQEYGTRFKIAYSISGIALDQFEMYAPDVLESFQRLVKTGCVEILGETYSHSLCALREKEEFFNQVRLHSEKVEQLFGKKPTIFRNTELIYSDNIGEMVDELGFKGMLTEGAKHILGWKSPNFIYCSATQPKLKLLLKNFRLSDDIAFRFSNRGWSEWPLTTEKYVAWLNAIVQDQEIVNLFMDYETFGEHQWADTGIFEFMRYLPKTVFANSNYQFVTPSEATELLTPVAQYIYLTQFLGPMKKEILLLGLVMICKTMLLTIYTNYIIKLNNVITNKFRKTGYTCKQATIFITCVLNGLAMAMYISILIIMIHLTKLILII